MLARVSDTVTVPALQLSGLVKRFGTKTAVAGIDLTVPAGSFYGLVGPNGAGKTTTLSMATGILRPDAGAAIVHGIRAEPLTVRREDLRLVHVTESRGPFQSRVFRLFDSRHAAELRVDRARPRELAFCGRFQIARAPDDALFLSIDPHVPSVAGGSDTSP